LGGSGSMANNANWGLNLYSHQTDGSGNYGLQMSGGANDNQLFFIRRVSNGSFGSWFEMWHSGNDGSGSGLDADTLDGSQGSYYLDAGNLTGSLDIDRLPTKDEDNMASNSADHVPTQQSVKAYVDSQSSGAVSAVANGSNNRIATFSSSTALNGEANLTFNGSTLALTGALSASSTITTNYGVAFTNGNTNFLQYNNSGEDVLYLRDTTNSAMVQTWGVNSVQIHRGLTVNQDGGNYDTRIEGDTDTHLFFVDASADRVGISTSSPGATLDIGDRIYLKDDGTIHWGSAAAHGILSWDTGRAIVTATGANNLDLKAASGYQVVVNESQSNVDFRVESDTNAHLLFADASSNRIGILRSSPNATLDVAGIGQFRGTSSEAVNLYLGQTTSNSAFMYEFSTYDDAGGIINAGDHLQIKSYRWGQDISFARNGQGGAVPTARFFSSGSSGYFLLYKATDPTNNANYETRVKLNVNGNSYLNGGNIGMGLTNPDVRLHVKDASNDVYLRLETDKTNGNAQVQYFNDAQQYNLGVNNADKFSLWDNTASATRFDIATDGDFKFYGTGSNFESVGGGSATYLLLSGTATQRIEFRNTDNNANGWIGIPSWNTDAWHEYLPTSSGNELAYIYESSRHNYYRGFTVNNGGDNYDFIVKGQNDDTLLYTDASTDRVGIGTSSIGELLHVDGSIEFAGRKYNRGSVTVTGAGTSNGQAITLSTELGTTLHVNYQYRITLNTTGTGTDTGAVYILTYDQDNSAWKLHLVSRKGSSSNHPLAVVDGSNLKVYHNHANAYNILYFVELWDMAADDGTLHGWGSDFMWTRDVNTLSYTDGLVEASIDLGSGSNTIKKTFATNNYPAVTIHSSGTGDSGAAIAIQQATTEGDTIIFADFEPHVEWGINTENGANRIDFTGGSSSPSLGSKTFKNNSGNDRTAYRKMSVRLDNGNVDIAGNLTVANGSSYAGDSTSGVLSTGSWIGDLGSNGWERVCGVQHDGGVFSIVEKNAQISTIVDGSYFAYESGTNQGGGFYSSTSSNYANAPGIRASGASQLYVVQADGGTSDLKVSGAITVQAGDDFALGELTNTLRMKGNGNSAFNFLNSGNGWANLYYNIGYAHSYYQANTNGTLLRMNISSWSNAPTHDIIYNSYGSNLGDYTYLKSAGNSTNTHGMLINSDKYLFWGRTDIESGSISNSATAPITDVCFRVDEDGNGLFDGDVVAFSTTIASDAKLKENVENLNYGLKDVLDIRPVSFDWKDKRNGQHDIGVIAQEIEKIIPEVVVEVDTLNSEDTHKTVDYAKLTSVLIKAVQEQQQQINELKEKLNG